MLRLLLSNSHYFILFLLLFSTSLFLTLAHFFLPHLFFLLTFDLYSSIQVHHMLQQKWEFALDPTSEVKRSLNRLKALEKASSGGCHSDAELAFLVHSSSCWNRSVLLHFLRFILYHYILLYSFILLPFFNLIRFAYSIQRNLAF